MYVHTYVSVYIFRPAHTSCMHDSHNDSHNEARLYFIPTLEKSIVYKVETPKIALYYKPPKTVCKKNPPPSGKKKGMHIYSSEHQCSFSGAS